MIFYTTKQFEIIVSLIFSDLERFINKRFTFETQKWRIHLWHDDILKLSNSFFRVNIQKDYNYHPHSYDFRLWLIHFDHYISITACVFLSLMPLNNVHSHTMSN